MKVKNKTTGKESEISKANYAKLKARSEHNKFTILSSDDEVKMPKDVAEKLQANKSKVAKVEKPKVEESIEYKAAETETIETKVEPAQEDSSNVTTGDKNVKTGGAAGSKKEDNKNRN